MKELYKYFEPHLVNDDSFHYVQALSGGGAKGYGQIQLLVKMEQQLKSLKIPNKQHLCDVIDLLAGSSVGAINAALIATGKISMTDLEIMYANMVKKIFTKRKWAKRLFGKRYPKYSYKNFDDVWNSVIGKEFKFGDVKTNLMITSVDEVTCTNRFFKSWKENCADEPLHEVVKRSFAAPIFFGHIVDEKRRCVWMDGGVGYSNLPLDEIKNEVEIKGWYSGSPHRCNIDAIGCLLPDEKPNFKKVARGGVIRQTHSFMQPKEGGLARVQSTPDQVRKINWATKHIDNLFYRYWDANIPTKKDGLDKIKYLDLYKQAGIKMSKRPLAP